MDEQEEGKPVLMVNGNAFDDHLKDECWLAEWSKLSNWNTEQVNCPICLQPVSPAAINAHLDSHLTPPRPLPGAHSHSQSILSFKRKAPDNTPTLRSRPCSSAILAPPSPKLASSAKAICLKPLAERVQPNSLDQCIGPSHLLGKPGLLQALLQTGSSIILWGPPGSGKTTLARSLAGSGASHFQELTGSDFGAAEWRKIIADHNLRVRFTSTQSSLSRRLIVFIDEAHRLNKTQQDFLLPHIDSGEVMVVLATTENPSFKFATRLMSRCRMIELPPYSRQFTLAILQRASKLLDQSFEDEILERIAAFAGGDARLALGQLEILLEYAKQQSISLRDLPTILSKRYALYDRDGDCHYDMISALHKSVRGSDPNAALYWLARMLEGGEDPLYVARRLVRMASEDIGAGNPHALTQAVSAFQATQLIGMPEADTILAQVVVMLAESPKSVRSYNAYKRAKSLVGSSDAHAVPVHLRNAPTKMMKELGYGAEYKYEPEFAHPITQDFWPREIEEGKRALLADLGPAAGESLEGKRVDFALLSEWEVSRNGGQAWSGRLEPAAVVKNEPDAFISEQAVVVKEEPLA